MTAKKKTAKPEYVVCPCGSTTFFRYTEVSDKIKIYAKPIKRPRRLDVIHRVVEKNTNTETKDICCTECGEEI